MTKANDPPARDGSPVIPAGEKAAFTLRASTHPKSDDPPPPVYPPGAKAVGVMLTDTLPVGMTYVTGSAIASSEDLNGNGVLDLGEDTNGNGRIDTDVPLEPTVELPTPYGTTTLVWSLGDFPFKTESAVIRYEARVSRLVRSGTSLTNWAAVTAKGDGPVVCTRRYIDESPVPDVPDVPEVADEASGSLRAARRRLNDSPSMQRVPPDYVLGLCAWAQVIVANAAAAQVEKVSLPAVVSPGERMSYRLGLANLSRKPAEWFDAVDLLPRPGEPRSPESRITGGIERILAVTDPYWPYWSPIEVWASAIDPAALDTAAGGVRDGLVDPVTAWGGGVDGGAELGGVTWPCLLADVGSPRCVGIASADAVTALRFWGPDPAPAKSGSGSESFLPVDGNPRFIDITLQVPGSQPGDIANNAWGGRFEGLPLPVFDSAVIRVPPLHTPTPEPTSTATPTSTLPATPTSTATAASTPTRIPTPTSVVFREIYLPIALRLPCVPQPVDAVLVIDVSSSMLRDAGDGGSKLDAVMRASRAFLDRFDPGSSGGRVAIAVFNERAWIVQPLTDDRERLKAAIDGLPAHIEEGTRLDLGLSVGAEAVGPASPGRWRAMIFLTDGLPNRVPTPESGGRQEDTVLAAAAEVRARGIEIHTVGYGRVDAVDIADRISPDLLREIAGDGSRYHETDDAGALADVFRRIAGEIGCGRDRGWP